MIGKDVEEIGRLTGKSAADTVFDLVAEERNMVNEVDFGMSEEDIEFIMKKEYVMPGSDGESYSLDFGGQPHPRNEDTPTYENPKKACKGIRKVFVNGKLAASDGAVTNCKAGKILRK